MFRYLPNTALKASLNIGTNYLRILQSIQQILLLFNITKLQLFDRALAAAVIETSEEVASPRVLTIIRFLYRKCGCHWECQFS